MQENKATPISDSDSLNSAQMDESVAADAEDVEEETAASAEAMGEDSAWQSTVRPESQGSSSESLDASETLAAETEAKEVADQDPSGEEGSADSSLEEEVPLASLTPQDFPPTDRSPDLDAADFALQEVGASVSVQNWIVFSATISMFNKSGSNL